jgi:hypothetical protein
LKKSKQAQQIRKIIERGCSVTSKMSSKAKNNNKT